MIDQGMSLAPYMNLFGAPGAIQSNPMSVQAGIQSPVPQLPPGAVGSDAAISSTVSPSGGITDPQLMGLISIAGQMGAALAPKDSWQSRLGGVAANAGSQKLTQMAAQEAEKRQMQFYKELFAGKTPTQIEALKAKIADPNQGPAGDLPDLLGKTPASQSTPISTGFDPAKWQPSMMGR